MEPWMRRASLSSRTNIRSWHSWEYRSMKSLLGKACSTHSSRLSSLGHLVKSLIWFKWSNCLDSSHRTYFEMDRILGYGSTRLVSIYGPFIAMLISLDIHARRLSNPNNLLSGQLRERTRGKDERYRRTGRCFISSHYVAIASWRPLESEGLGRSPLVLLVSRLRSVVYQS